MAFMSRILVGALVLAWSGCGLWTKTDCVTTEDCLWWRECIDGVCQDPVTQVDASKAPQDANLPPDSSIPEDDGGHGDAGHNDAGRDAGNRDAATGMDAAVGMDAAGPSDAAGPVDSAGMDAAVDPDGGCACGAGLVCLYAQCLPGCMDDSTCGFSGVCDTATTALCQCADGLQPCGAGCCSISVDTVAARVMGTGGWMGEGLSMALDSQGRVHVVYYEEDGSQLGTLWYAFHDGAMWVKQAVDQGTLVGQDPSLALDILDTPHIAYSGGGSVGLRYATLLPAGTWDKHDVGLNNNGSDNDLVVRGTPGVDLQLHIATSGLSLYYVRGGPGAWDNEQVDGFGGKDPSLRFSADGVPHIAFFDSENTSLALKLAIRTGLNTWDVRQVEPNLGASTYPSLDFDSIGRVHIAYRDATRNALRVAIRVAPVDGGILWGKATLDQVQTGVTGFYPVLRLDAQDDPLVAYTYSTGTTAHVRLLRYRNGGSVITAMDRGTEGDGVGGCFRSYVGMCLDMELDAQGNPVLVYPDMDRRAVVVTR